MKDLFKKGGKTPSTAKPKKALFGKASRKVATDSAVAKSTALNQTNTNKIIAILVVALVLILLALAAKVFLFNDDAMVDEAIVAEPDLVEAVATSEPNGDEVLETAVPPASEDTVVVSDTSVAVPVEEVESNVEVPAIQQPKQELSYDEFIKETESKIYREHNTAK